MAGATADDGVFLLVPLGRFKIQKTAEGRRVNARRELRHFRAEGILLWFGLGDGSSLCSG